MPRTLLPPEGIFVPTSILYDKTIPPSARDTWIRLRGLAWGKTQTPPLEVKMICDLFGISQSTLYGHMLLLKHREACTWSTVSKQTIIVSFGNLNENSKNLESPNLVVNQLNKEDLNQPFQKTGNSRKLENKSVSGVSTQRAITDKYCELLGYKPDNWAEGEGAAAARIAKNYTPDQLAEAYKHFKADKFWASKRLMLRWLAGQMPDYFKAKADGQLAGAPMPGTVTKSTDGGMYV
jgi:hypothetical protein